MRKIGWIGAGIMGQPMVIHLLNKGYEVHGVRKTSRKGRTS